MYHIILYENVDSRVWKKLDSCKESGTSESSDPRGRGILECPTGLFGGFEGDNLGVSGDIQEQIDAGPRLKSP